MRFTREMYMAKHLTNKAEKGSAIVLYGQSNGVYLAQAFSGKRAKPDWFYRFKTEQEMLDRVDAHLKAVDEHEKRTKAYKAERKVSRASEASAFKAKLKPGAILYDTWGYEQTNVEFYIVLAVKGSKVTIAELGHKTVPGSDGRDCCRVTPDENSQSASIQKIVRGSSIRICDSISLRLWDGTSLYKSWYY